MYGGYAVMRGTWEGYRGHSVEQGKRGVWFARRSVLKRSGTGAGVLPPGCW